MRTLRVILAAYLFSALNAGASDNSSRAALASLPVAAQANVSAALGRDSAEFFARPVDGGFLANSRGLTARFIASGVEMTSGSARWGLALRGYGYGNSLRSVSPATPQASKNRVEYRRGAMTEWYVNGPMGLEQGFTIKERPGKSDGRPLTIALATAGNLTPIAEDNAGLTLKTASGQEVLRYAGLMAYDADGEDLKASMRLQGQQLLLQVNDRRARYPIVIDPVVQLAKLTASDGFSGEGFGTSVAMSGNVIVVGTNGGEAYVFVKPLSGWKNMIQTARLTPSDHGAGFGASVAIGGNVIVVGAPQANQSQGAAYAFLKPAGGWKDMTETARLAASDGAPGDGFGYAVAVSGRTGVVGAPFAAVNGTFQQGAAYVFVADPASSARLVSKTITETAKLTASDPTGGDQFGISVSSSGDAVAIGALIGDEGKGEAYVFVKPPTGWVSATETAQLKPSDSGGDMGVSVATSGGSVAVGALTSRGGAGSVYVFVEPQSGWADMTETAQLLPANCCWSFGLSVSIDGAAGAIAVGAPHGNGHQNGAGDVFVFLRPPGGWQTTMQYKYRLFSSDGVFGDLFAQSVALSGKTLVSGAPIAGGKGAAYVFGAN